MRTAGSTGFEYRHCSTCQESRLHHHSKCVRCGHLTLEIAKIPMNSTTKVKSMGREGNQRVWRALRAKACQ